jgi:type IV pilus assembly protein PilY1
MNTPTPQRARLALAVASALGVFGQQAHAQIVVNDTLTGLASTYNWIPTGGACLTAGDSSSGTIKGCLDKTFTYYTSKSSKLVGGDSGTLPDIKDKGALRLTNGDTTNNGSNGNQQTGAVVSADGFPMDGGVNITWTSVTYGGNAYKPSGGNANGADGISFFLSDYAAEAPNGPTDVGGSGGSLGYSCSNTNATYNGVRGGYLAVGIDEYGNFANSSDNTSSGRGTGGFYPGLISMRGAGDTNWYSFTKAGSSLAKYYPAGTNTQTIMNATCKAGYPINNSSVNQTDSKNQTVKPGKQATNDGPLPNYGYLVPSAYPAQFTIANQEAIATPKRKDATPITFNLSITKDGLLTFAYSVNGGTSQPVFTSYDIVANNGALPAKVRFGFSAGTGGGSNVHEITCFKAQPNSQSSGSAGSTSQPTAKIPGGAQIYLAFYNSNNWYGTLKAYGVDTLGNIATGATWEANCQLTGSTLPGCTATPPLPASRNILSYDDSGKKGTAFGYSTLSGGEQTALNTDANGANRVLYLRGDRTNEKGGTGLNVFRARTGLMGDIIDSSPVWVGPPQAPYTTTFLDKLGAAAVPEGLSYTAFATGAALNRTNVVYVGANDGMLHGFNAGTYNGSTYGGTNDGSEVLAYVPGAVANMIHQAAPALDYSSPSYSHNFYVDGTPGTGDLYYNGTWHTWLVAGLGAGGQPAGAISDQTTPTSTSAIYALDITDPAKFVAGSVLGEWTPSTITCANVANCGQHLGLTYGTPQIRRLHNGNWAILFGNGLNSKLGTSGMFVGIVDSSGKPTFYYYDTGAGPTSASPPVLNGIVQVTPVDLDGDHITDFVYAGDVLGNVWRFDLTSNSPGTWAAGSKPLFTTASGQPITTGLAVASVPTGTSANALPKVLVAFGTGQKLPLTVTSGETYATATQALYGVWDYNMTAWDSTSTDTKYAALAPTIRTNAGKSLTIQSGELVTQTYGIATNSGTQYRTATSNPVCWADATACAATPQMGWTMALQAASSTAIPPTPAEQVIFNPVVISNEIVLNTFLPVSSTAKALFCNAPDASGFTMALQMANGGASSESFLPLPDGTFSNTISVVGLADGAVGTPAPLNGSDGKTYIVSGTVTGGYDRKQTNYSGGVGMRLNWTKVR